MAGVRDRQYINPDNWNLDQYLLDRPENAAAQLELFYNYRKNLERYPEWHEYTVQVLSTPHIVKTSALQVSLGLICVSKAV